MSPQKRVLSTFPFSGLPVCGRPGRLAVLTQPLKVYTQRVELQGNNCTNSCDINALCTVAKFFNFLKDNLIKFSKKNVRYSNIHDWVINLLIHTQAELVDCMGYEVGTKDKSQLLDIVQQEEVRVQEIDRI